MLQVYLSNYRGNISIKFKILYKKDIKFSPELLRSSWLFRTSAGCSVQSPGHSPHCLVPNMLQARLPPGWSLDKGHSCIGAQMWEIGLSSLLDSGERHATGPEIWLPHPPARCTGYATQKFRAINALWGKYWPKRDCGWEATDRKAPPPHSHQPSPLILL